MNVTITHVCMERHVSMRSTGTTAHARQDTPATGVRQVGSLLVCDVCHNSMSAMIRLILNIRYY